MKEWLQILMVALCLFLIVFFGAIRLNNMIADKDQQLYEQCISYKKASLAELFVVNKCERFFKKE